MANYTNNEHSGLESERRPFSQKPFSVSVKKLCDLISLSLVSLHYGVEKNKEAFITEFCSVIINDSELASVIYDHLCAISVGMRIA